MSKIFTIDAPPTAPLPTPASIMQELPASPAHIQFVQQSRNEVARILSGEDPRMLLIVGPCSIHDSIAAKEYAIKLQKLAEEVASSFFVIMRTYFEKPRTSNGWKGIFYDPHLDGSHDINTGLRCCRKLLLELAALGLPAATEFLDPVAPSYFGDLTTWACIGARTAESQPHRQLASGLPMPVAFKNSTSGNVDVAIQGAHVAATPQTYIGLNEHGQLTPIRTRGNAHPHIVLRGSQKRPNYDTQSISAALDRLEQSNQPRRLIVDCSHGNSARNHLQQVEVFRAVLQQRIQGNDAIKGVAIESHLLGGNQQHHADLAKLQYGISLTDPCLDWTTTEQLIRWGANLLQNQETAAPLANRHAAPSLCAQV